MRDPAPLNPDRIPRLVDRLLDSAFCLPALEPLVGYARRHDDPDGAGAGTLCVTLGPDGDAWLTVDGSEPLRFRVPLIGGGESDCTHAALVLLAEAIRRDNERRPQRAVPDSTDRPADAVANDATPPQTPRAETVRRRETEALANLYLLATRQLRHASDPAWRHVQRLAGDALGSDTPTLEPWRAVSAADTDATASVAVTDEPAPDRRGPG